MASIKWALAVLSALLSLSISSAAASDKSDLEAKGLKPASGEEIRTLKVGKTCVATGFDEAGKEQMTSTNSYREDGTAIKVQGSDSRQRRWWMDGTRYCETLYANDQEWCGAHEVFHKLDDQLYIFRDNGKIQFIEVCR